MIACVKSKDATLLHQQVIQERLVDPPMQTPETDAKLRFDGDNRLQVELRRRVEEFFRSSGRRRRDCPQRYLKTAIILTGFTALYLLLVLAAITWRQAVPLAILLGLAAVLIGFNVEHDGSHKAYSNHAWVNKLMAMIPDMVGGSSYLWRWKHVVFHHMYVNISGHDTDIDIGIFGRLGFPRPHQRTHGGKPLPAPARLGNWCCSSSAN